jgi:flagellar motor switch protein FliN
LEELSALEKDTISEVGNISLGSSATALSVILDRMVDITTPRLSIINYCDIRKNYPLPCLVVEVEYTSGLEGNNMFLLREQDAVIIASMMMGEPFEGREGSLSEIELSAIQEAMTQMMGSMATSMSELFQRSIEISPPKVVRINLADDEKDFPQFSPEDKVVQVEFKMKVEDIIDSVMIQVVPLEFAKNMAGYLLTGEPEPASVSGVIKSAEPEAASESCVDSGQLQPGGNIAEPAVNSCSSAYSAGMSDLEKDTISEVGNISLGSSATALSVILDKVVEITTPRLSILKVRDIQEKYPIPCVLVEVDYISGLEGSNMLLVKKSDAMIIASMMMGDLYEGLEGKLSEIEMSAVQEAMNQMMGSMATSMSDLFQRPVDISPPSMRLIDLGDDQVMLSDLNPEDDVVHVEFRIKVEEIIDSVMFQVIPLDFARRMAGQLLYGNSASAAEPPAAHWQDHDHINSATSHNSETKPEICFEEPLEENAYKSGNLFSEAKTPLSVDLQKLELVKDIPMDVTVVLGSARIPLGRLFSLGRGGIVDLDCSVSDPVEIMANDRLLAKGEVVMINDQLGVRITEIQFEEVIESYGI